MRISRLQLRDVKRYRDLQIDLAPGLTIIRGPNESGKTTISRAIELGLSGSVTATDPASAAGARRPSVVGRRSRRLDRRSPSTSRSTAEGPAAPSGRVRSRRRSAPGGTRRRSPSTASRSAIRRGRCQPGRSDRHPDPGVLPVDGPRRSRRARGPRSRRGDPPRRVWPPRSAPPIGTRTRRSRSCAGSPGRPQPAGRPGPGRLGVAEEAVARSEASLAAGEAALARLVADREALGAAADASDIGGRTSAARRALLEQARNAELLTAEHAAATERHARYDEAVSGGRRARQARATPTRRRIPLPVRPPDRRPAAGPRREDDRAEGDALGRDQGRATRSPRPRPPGGRSRSCPWSPSSSGSRLGIAGQLLAGMSVLSFVGLGVAIVGVVLALLAVPRPEGGHGLPEAAADGRDRGRAPAARSIADGGRAAARPRRTARPSSRGSVCRTWRPPRTSSPARRPTSPRSTSSTPGSRVSSVANRSRRWLRAGTRPRAQAADSAAKLADLEPEARAPGARERFESEVTGRPGSARPGADRRGAGPGQGRRQPGRRRAGRRRGGAARDLARAARRPPAPGAGQRGGARRPRTGDRDDDGFGRPATSRSG